MLTSVLFICLAVTFEGSPNWPAFLGSGSQNLSSETLPLTWSPDENILWRAEVTGHGQSSPVVWGDKAFVTSVQGPMKETWLTTCFDTKSGQQLWQKSLPNSTPVKNSYYVSRAAPTPVVDSERLVVQFESGDCVAYSHSGELLWSRELAKDYGPFEAEFGLGASLCQSGNLVFALLEHDGPSCLVALEKSTGKTAWKADRTPRRSWTSPAIINVGEEPQVIVSSAGSIDGYSPSTGELLWTFADIGGNTGTTPMDCGQGRFLVGASAGRQGENADAAKDSNCMMQIEKLDGVWQATKLWANDQANPSWASPILHQGFAYWVNRVGVIYCIDAKTGEQIYAQRSSQSCWATPFAVADRIYFFGKDGQVTVLAAGSEYKVLAENVTWKVEDLPPDTSVAAEEETDEQRQRGAAMFSGPTLYGYAVAGDRFIVRIGNQVICIGG